MVQLKQIASIQTGLFAKTSANGDVVYLQAKHFDENGKLRSVLHPDLNGSNVTDKHLLKHGDVLFAAKGFKNFAAWYESKNMPAVASTSFFVIRLQTDLILPEFLTWFLNSPGTQKFLKANATGSAMVSISKTVLEELEVPVPTIENQQVILKITDLLSREKQLKQQIEMLQEKKIQQLIEKFIS